MDERGHSPRRRHILASINQEPPKPLEDSKSETGAPSADEVKYARSEDEAKDRSRRKRLKLKDGTGHRSSRRRSPRDRSRDRSRDRGHGRSSRHHRADDDRRRRRRRRRSRSPTPPNPHEEPRLDPEAAFRESLFDAMADDEGAAYWEGVYGQPIHVYSNERDGPQGELERMTDDEYAAYVRQKMWEKTHDGLLEERARREEAKKAQQKQERERRKLAREIEQSLLVGEERRAKRAWRQRWDDYQKRWAAWDGTIGTVPWPAGTGSERDVSEDAVKSFYLGCLREEGAEEGEFIQKLKDERVRWHPDKIQQRLGGQVDEEVMRDVTAIFQTIDKMWNDTRRKES